jgi:hypothetical protein
MKFPPIPTSEAYVDVWFSTDHALVTELREPHSYRGYYSDLAFEGGTSQIEAHELLASCKSAMGKVFTGYKGGDFMMGELTPLWVASYGIRLALKVTSTMTFQQIQEIIRKIKP